MKNKRNMLLLLFSIVCVCFAAVVCLISFLNLRNADSRISILESEVEYLGSTSMQTEEANAVLETESRRIETEQEEETEMIVETEAAEATEESVINGYTVAIDPGHQGSWVDMSAQEPVGPGSSEMKAKATTGTSGRYTGIPEYQLNLDISLALKAELESRGYSVVMTRTDNDTAISNAERATKAYQEGGDVYVRIHANGSDDTSINGALAMVPSSDNSYVSFLAEDSYNLAECILNSYCERTGFGNLGVQYYDNMTGINWSQIPVMILEMGFMTNESDDTAMADADMRIQMVQGISDGIDKYFGREE